MVYERMMFNKIASFVNFFFFSLCLLVLSGCLFVVFFVEGFVYRCTTSPNIANTKRYSFRNLPQLKDNV